MKRLPKILTLWFLIGAVYYALEGLWHISSGGYANIIMLPIGGLCGVVVGSLNQVPKIYNSKVATQAFLGAIIITAIELVSGLILNVWLGLDLWDYSSKVGNIAGQVCIHYGMLWFLICPACIWLEDALRYKLWGEGEYYTLMSIYQDLVHLR